jgi:hypothetical protein
VGRISNKPVSCKKQCDKDYNTLKKQECSLHKANKKACGSDAACKAAEDARHNAALAQLQQQAGCLQGELPQAGSRFRRLILRQY